MFIVIPSILFAQNRESNDTLFFKQQLIDYSMDASGGIFLSFEGGSITKYSPTLDSLFTYSPSKQGNTTLLESGTGLVIFAFYEFFQEYLITDRFLARPVRTKLASFFIDYIDIATQSQDNNIWLVETSNFRLLKYNVTVNRIETETILNTIIDTPNNHFTFIKEYQNQVFLVDEHSGIYVFDNLGNFSRKIKAFTKKVNFQKNDMYYLENDTLITIGLYNNEKHVTLFSENNLTGVLKNKNYTYLITTTRLFIDN